ncbi:Zinc finger protein [Aspergillus sclerotialis]|uniref:Zinc finger protein n=1 Tax=Aspergillus sclerotialis TaxID=2070753 RepID=A0A3A2ZHI6_9EURO|nr:Zinc finger protein [Aspergillus sclerotialis]
MSLSKPYLSNDPQMSSSMLAELTNTLSAELDAERNEAIEEQLKIPRDCPAKIIASVLSPHSTARMPSVLASYRPFKLATAIGYRAIGFGQCGLVFERPGRDYVIKVAKPAYEGGLWPDFRAHFRTRQAFEKEGRDVECRVPKIYSYVPKRNSRWWNENRPFFYDVHQSLFLPSNALITERIPPLPKVARQALINKYCPPQLQHNANANPTNRDCLARIYLGRRRPINAPLSPNFTLRNYNLTLDQIVELGLPAASFAAAMGEALAIIHWAANIDAYDIEFVLGSEAKTPYTQDISLALNLTTEQIAAMEPDTDIESLLSTKCKPRTARMWVLDFNLCNIWEEKAGWENPEMLLPHLVEAFFENDPYYPLPLMEQDLERELWDTFSSTYIDKGTHILSAPGKDSRLVNLPRIFIDSCVKRERQNLSNSLGHGYRELKC